MASGMVGRSYVEIGDAGQAVFHRKHFARYASLLSDAEALASSALWSRMVDPGIGCQFLEPQEFLDELRRYLEAASPDGDADAELYEEFERRVFYLTREWTGRTPDPIDAELLSLPAYLMVSDNCRSLFNFHHAHEVTTALIYAARNADEPFAILLYNAIQECFARGIAADAADRERYCNMELGKFVIGCVGMELHRRMVLSVDTEDDGFGFFDYIDMCLEGARASETTESPDMIENGEATLTRYFNEGILRLKPRQLPD